MRSISRVREQLIGVARRLFEPSSPLQRRVQAHVTELRRMAEDRPTGGLRVYSDRRVVVAAGLTRLEIAMPSPGVATLRVPSDPFLPGLKPLDSERRALLRALGAHRAERSSHFAVDYAAGPSSDRQIALDACRVVTELLQEDVERCDVEIAPEPQLDEASLIDAMRKLAKARDQASRTRVYQECINAWFYLPIEVADGPDAEPRPRQWGPEKDRFEWVAFSSRAALDEFVPPGDPYLLVSGIRLLLAGAARRVEALHLNPSSPVGGQLLRGELDTIADYLGRMGIGG